MARVWARTRVSVRLWLVTGFLFTVTAAAGTSPPPPAPLVALPAQEGGGGRGRGGGGGGAAAARAPVESNWEQGRVTVQKNAGTMGDGRMHGPTDLDVS